MILKLMRARTLLFPYLAAMLLLYAWILMHTWERIVQGFPDFTIFYTAGQILQSGRVADLYDNHLQKAIQEAVTPVAVAKRGSILPYNHPPFEAVLFLPLSHFGYVHAYMIWVGLNVAFLVWLALLLRRVVPTLQQLPAYLWLLLVFTFDPLFIALLQGQDSILLLGCFTLAYVCFLRGAEFRAGVWLGLGLFKFNLILPFVFPLILVNRRKFAAGFSLIAVALFSLSLFVVGWRGLFNYPVYVWSTEQDKAYLWNMAHDNQTNLRGLCNMLTSDPLPRAVLLVLTSAAVLLLTSLVWRKLDSSRSIWFQRAFAVVLLGAVLLSFHLYLHDLSVLLLALVAAVEYVSHRPELEGWLKVSVYTGLAILSCSPLYLLLTLRFKQFQLMAFVLLGVFTVLAWDAMRRQRETSEGSAAAAAVW